MAARSAPRHRLDRAEPVDEQPVAGVGRHPPGAGVGGGDQALLLERGHVVADGGRRDPQLVPVEQRLGTHRLGGLRRSPARSRAARRDDVPRSSDTSCHRSLRLCWHSGSASAKSTWFPAPGTARAARPRREAVGAAYPASVSDRYGSDVLSGDWKVPAAGPLPRGRGRDRPGRRGRRDRLVRRRGPGREGRRHARRPPRGPARPHQGLPDGPGFPARRRPGRPDPAHRGRPRAARRGPGRRLAHRLGLTGRRGRPGQGGQRVADLRRGPPRRRAGREGLGRRPARRGRRRRAARRGRRPRRRRSRDFQPGPGRRMGVLVDHLLPGTKEHRVVQDAARSRYAAHVRVLGPPVRRRVAERAPRAAGAGAVAGHPPRPVVEATASARTSAGRTTARPTSPGPGSRSSARSAPTPTSSRPCWPASRSSSTS